jgi:hypothetical protein
MTIQEMQDRIRMLRAKEMECKYYKESLEYKNLIRMYQRIIRRVQNGII